MTNVDGFEYARDRWREHTLGCPRCGIDRMCPTGKSLEAQWKSAAKASFEARRDAGPVAAYQRLFGDYQAQAENIRPKPRATLDDTPRPAADWTDDEWLAAMAQFPPDTPIYEAERWIEARRGS